MAKVDETKAISSEDATKSATCTLRIHTHTKVVFLAFLESLCRHNSQFVKCTRTRKCLFLEFLYKRIPEFSYVCKFENSGALRLSMQAVSEEEQLEILSCTFAFRC